MKAPTKSELKAAESCEGLVDASADWIEIPWESYNADLRKAFIEGMRYQRGYTKMKNMIPWDKID